MRIQCICALMHSQPLILRMRVLGLIDRMWTGVGGPDEVEVSAESMVRIESGHVIGDDFWLARRPSLSIHPSIHALIRSILIRTKRAAENASRTLNAFVPCRVSCIISHSFY